MIHLDGVPETMLWTLYNRATEALRPDAWIKDPEAVRIYQSIAYDYARSFGVPDSSHAVRSLMFDEVVGAWMKSHPGGTVVELACGLETQFHRCDDGRVRWLCVDVPEAIDVRERFLSPSERCRHLRGSAFDEHWMDEVDPSRGVFVTAQGLFMYFEEAQIKTLVTRIAERWSEVDLMFDMLPRWLSRKTLSGLWATPHYRVPPMPWGVNRDEIAPLLKSWSKRVVSVAEAPYRRYRGFPEAFVPLIAYVPLLWKYLPNIVHARFSSSEENLASRAGLGGVGVDVPAG
ncbi:class I SAM-dependent methyltransferase [Lysobacter pythonis]|uniref:Class I SAM-dependent methyltransferase n=2 Tax=Solilutibacter pythonis TaxID=2483112 RepID=A0A3M2I9K0_9GAMM|nr:class I SAM-dependent methyltransferase [Lysobacter pythonis]